MSEVFELTAAEVESLAGAHQQLTTGALLGVRVPESVTPQALRQLLARFVDSLSATAVLQQALESAPTVIGPATLTALRAREAAWRDIEHRYGYLTAQDIGDLAGSRSKNRTEYASARLREGKLAAVRRAGRLLFPAFQFERSTGHPITELAAVLDVFHAADWDDESILLWFTAPNGRLAGADPAGLLAADPADVLAAAADAAATW